MLGTLRSRPKAILAVMLCLCAFAAAAETYTIPAELWDRPRTGRVLLEQPAIRQAVRGYLEHAGRRLVIHYPAGQEPLLYAEELRSWLIALAVEGEHIALKPDRQRGEPLTLEVTQ